MNHFISIIIPVYKTEEYLPRCIESVINQSYSNLEIILVDDGSMDRSGLICDEYARYDSRIKVIHKDNGGISSARNIGLEIASGDYIGFVDSDDWVLPQMFERMIYEAEEQNADMVVSGIIFDNFIKQHRLCDEKIRILENKELIEAYLSDVYINNVVWNKIYKKDILENIRFPLVKRSEDVIFTIEVLSNVKKAVYINECYYVQILREGSLERSSICDNDLLLLDSIRFRQNFVK